MNIVWYQRFPYQSINLSVCLSVYIQKKKKIPIRIYVFCPNDHTCIIQLDLAPQLTCLPSHSFRPADITYNPVSLSFTSTVNRSPDFLAVRCRVSCQEKTVQSVEIMQIDKHFLQNQDSLRGWKLWRDSHDSCPFYTSLHISTKCIIVCLLVWKALKGWTKNVLKLSP